MPAHSMLIQVWNLLLLRVADNKEITSFECRPLNSSALLNLWIYRASLQRSQVFQNTTR